MEYRIKEYKFKDGTFIYEIQKKMLWFWTPVGSVRAGFVEFNTIEQAENWVNNHTVVSERII